MVREVVQRLRQVARRRVAVAEPPVLARAPRPRAAARRAAQVVPPRRVARHLRDALILQACGVLTRLRLSLPILNLLFDIYYHFYVPYKHGI